MTATAPSLTFTRQNDVLGNTEYMAETETHRYVVRQDPARRARDGRWIVEVYALKTVGTLEPVTIAGKKVATLDYLYKRGEAYSEAQKHAHNEYLHEVYREVQKRTPALPRPGVAAAYADGTAITDGETFAPGRRESTADLVVTLASDLEKMAEEPGRAARVAAVWAELVFRGVTLT